MVLFTAVGWTEGATDMQWVEGGAAAKHLPRHRRPRRQNCLHMVSSAKAEDSLAQIP